VTITATGADAPAAPPARALRPMNRREGTARPVQALGSGFLIDAEGTIITNQHVVRGAVAVSVTLDDGSHFAARLLGTDPWTDLALLRIETGTPLPWLRLGNSDATRPGDWVVAMGNPFGLDGTVTAGIVSARGRSIGQGPYDDYFQVDAAINTGNSGGPLFATDGSVVGVNSAIYSPTGGSVGIGFAIPANLVAEVVAAINASGRMERGFLGATSQPLTPALAAALGMPGQAGALIDDVVPRGPAARAGIQAGDVVTAIDGTTITDARGMARIIARTRPDTVLALTVQRDGASQYMMTRIIPAPESPDRPPVLPEGRGPRFGVTLTALTDALRRENRLPRDTRGALVTDLAPNGGAALAGVQQGDVLIAVGAQEVVDPPSALAAMRAAGTGAVVLRVLRGGSGLFVALPAN
jgi:serine protease Do